MRMRWKAILGRLMRPVGVCGLALSAGWIACGGNVAEARPQWTVVISTDAGVPEFGDRLLVETYDANGSVSCSGCRRQLGVGKPSTWPWSFGVVTPEGGGDVWVRAQLYRVKRTGSNGLPEGEYLIDSFAKLPPADKAVRVSLPLDMRCFGVLADPVRQLSCDPETGKLAPAPTLTNQTALSTGSWAQLQPKPCRETVPDDMVCVPGGAFLLGNPIGALSDDRLSTRDERVVALSPFALDRFEVTVGQVRNLALSGAIERLPVERDPDIDQLAGLCTFQGLDDPSADDMPVNCIDHDAAAAICAAMSKRLPTEAEWEFAAGNRNQESSFPWGEDRSDLCNRAILARGRSGLHLHFFEQSWCRSNAGEHVVPPGPVAGGHEADVTELGIRNLAGNVEEWLADGFAPYSDPCWGTAGQIVLDPMCPPQLDDQDSKFSMRGASYAELRAAAAVFMRKAAPADFRDPSLGVRCAKDM